MNLFAGPARPALVALCAGALGFALVEGIARIRQRDLDARLDAAFAAQAAGWNAALQREVDLFTQVLEALGDVHVLALRTGKDSFANLAAGGLVLQRSELQAFGFARREIDVDGAERFPVVSVEPPSLIELGFDLAADPRQRERIYAAGRTNQCVAGAPWLSPDPLVLFPVHAIQFDEAARSWTTEWVGLAFAWMRPDRLLQRAMPAAAAAYVRVAWIPPGSNQEPATVTPEPVYTGTIRMADQEWGFRAQAIPGYRASHRPDTARWIRGSGWALALLAAWLAYAVSGRHQRVRELVAVRTRELEDAHAERMRLQQELIEAGRLERQRVGQDLHDSLGQKLSGAALMARAALQLADPAAARAQMERVADGLKDSVSQVRRIARGLAPVDLDDASLGDALKRLAAEIYEMRGIPCAVDAEPDLRLVDPARAMHVYQIAQEAVNNAARHAGAAGITITLKREAGGIHLRVEDDGRGLSGSESSDTGMGLRLMQHRASLLGASLMIGPRGKIKGTRVELTVLE